MHVKAFLGSFPSFPSLHPSFCIGFQRTQSWNVASIAWRWGSSSVSHAAHSRERTGIDHDGNSRCSGAVAHVEPTAEPSQRRSAQQIPNRKLSVS